MKRKITAEQYDCLYMAARNLRAIIHAKDSSSSYLYIDQLEKYTLMLTGSYAPDDIADKAVALAKTILYDSHREEIDKIVELFIGPFEYEPAPLNEEERKTLAEEMTHQMLSSK